MDCVFCKISSGEAPANKVLETDEVVCFYDRHPSADIHVLIVPKKHIESFRALDDDALAGKMRRAAQQLIDELSMGDGYRLVINGGRHQHVPHLHWHLLAGELKRPLPE